MSTSSRTLRKPVATAVLAFAALLATLVIGPAPTASAHSSGTVGNPGPYTITWDVDDRQAMIAGFWDTYVDSGGHVVGHRTFFTNGVTAQRSTASPNAQTIKATYKLQRWTDDGYTWVTMQEVTKQKNVPAYEEGVVSTATLGGHWFDNPPATPFNTPFRIIYKVEWLDNVTGAQLGYRDVYPDYQNNFCLPAAGAPACSVWNETIQW
jgi:hypothetical protein